MKSSMAVLALIVAALPAAGNAQSTSRIDQRQAEQQRRIDQGVRSGELTEKEVARLQEGQRRIQKMEDNARADGKITNEERRRIEYAQDLESERIRRETRDKQTARNPPQLAAPPSRIDQRQAEQQRRIDEGVKSGQLTRQEAAQLQKGQARVQQLEDKALADGKMATDERRRIERAQDRESERIRRETRDKRTAR